jgi:hypothetical protein
MRQTGAYEKGPIEGARVRDKTPPLAVLALAGGMAFLVLAAWVALV